MARTFFTIGTQPLYDEGLAIGEPVRCTTGKIAFATLEEAKASLRGDRHEVKWPAIYQVRVQSAAFEIDGGELVKGFGTVTRRVWPGPRWDLKP